MRPSDSVVIVRSLTAAAVPAYHEIGAWGREDPADGDLHVWVSRALCGRVLYRQTWREENGRDAEVSRTDGAVWIRRDRAERIAHRCNKCREAADGAALAGWSAR